MFIRSFIPSPTTSHSGCTVTLATVGLGDGVDKGQAAELWTDNSDTEAGLLRVQRQHFHPRVGVSGRLPLGRDLGAEH